jgi:hypothetical protein
VERKIICGESGLNHQITTSNIRIIKRPNTSKELLGFFLPKSLRSNKEQEFDIQINQIRPAIQ